MCDVGQLLNTDLHADRLIEAAKELLSDEPSPKRRKILTDLLLSLEDTSELESREDDEDWFKGAQSHKWTDKQTVKTANHSTYYLSMLNLVLRQSPCI